MDLPSDYALSMTLTLPTRVWREAKRVLQAAESRPQTAALDVIERDIAPYGLRVDRSVLRLNAGGFEIGIWTAEELAGARPMRVPVMRAARVAQVGVREDEEMPDQIEARGWAATSRGECAAGAHLRGYAKGIREGERRATEESRGLRDAVLILAGDLERERSERQRLSKELGDARDALEAEQVETRATARIVASVRAKIAALCAILDETATPEGDLPHGRLVPALRLAREIAAGHL